MVETAGFSLKPIILGFVFLILGIIFLGVIGDNQVANVTLSGVVNETIAFTSTSSNVTNETIAAFSSGQASVVEKGLVTVTFFGNVTLSTAQANITVNNDVNFSRDGLITIGQEHFPGVGPYNITYEFITTTLGNTNNVDVVGLSFVGNTTIGTQITDIDLGTQVNFTKAGVISLSPTNFSGGDYNATYQYEGALYVVDKKSHPFLNLNTLFFAIALIAIAVMIAMEASGKLDFGFRKD